MKTIPFYQIDAFANTLFKGNPAGVCPLENWIETELMQKIAAENNLSETAFYVKKNNTYHIRWFTPTVEINLCGHATLASAYVEFNERGNTNNEIIFENLDGQKLITTKKENSIELDFPADEFTAIPIDNIYQKAFLEKPIEAYKSGNMQLLVFKEENSIRNMKPNFELISKLEDCIGVIVTAKGNKTDIVCRFFAPQSGINEDPVTGAAHTKLIPFWSKKLKKTNITSMQLSERTGFLDCTYQNNRVKMAGTAQLYLKGTLYLEP